MAILACVATQRADPETDRACDLVLALAHAHLPDYVSIKARDQTSR